MNACISKGSFGEEASVDCASTSRWLDGRFCETMSVCRNILICVAMKRDEELLTNPSTLYMRIKFSKNKTRWDRLYYHTRMHSTLIHIKLSQTLKLYLIKFFC
jgi:hypothetical protein